MVASCETLCLLFMLIYDDVKTCDFTIYPTLSDVGINEPVDSDSWHFCSDFCCPVCLPLQARLHVVPVSTGSHAGVGDGVCRPAVDCWTQTDGKVGGFGELSVQVVETWFYS